MAPFARSDSERPNRLDWQILLNGAISLYINQSTLEDASAWFREHQYHIYRFDCRTWKTEETFYEDVRETFTLPEYCGGNLDSLNDCLGEIAIPYDSGAACIFFRFDTFARRYPQLAQGLLEIVEVNSRRFLLFGSRLIALVQSNDPKITFKPVGACPVLLNPVEFRNKIRGTKYNRH
jgi:RNAse (barnase) inhibitor barstar